MRKLIENVLVTAERKGDDVRIWMWDKKGRLESSWLLKHTLTVKSEDNKIYLTALEPDQDQYEGAKTIYFNAEKYPTALKKIILLSDIFDSKKEYEVEISLEAPIIDPEAPASVAPKAREEVKENLNKKQKEVRKVENGSSASNYLGGKKEATGFPLGWVVVAFVVGVFCTTLIVLGLSGKLTHAFLYSSQFVFYVGGLIGLVGAVMSIVKLIKLSTDSTPDGQQKHLIWFYGYMFVFSLFFIFSVYIQSRSMEEIKKFEERMQQMERQLKAKEIVNDPFK